MIRIYHFEIIQLFIPLITSFLNENTTLLKYQLTTYLNLIESLLIHEQNY